MRYHKIFQMQKLSLKFAGIRFLYDETKMKTEPNFTVFKFLLRSNILLLFQ